MHTKRFSPNRRQFLAGAGALMTMPIIGCGNAQRPRQIVGLIDLSSSVRKADWEGYLATLSSLVYSMRPRQDEAAADKLVLGPIDDQPLSLFATLMTASITYVGTPDRAEQIEQKRQEILAALRSQAPRPDTKMTRIIDSLAAVGEIVAADQSRDAEIVICSDMLEASPIANFEETPPSNDAIEETIGELGSMGMLPDLKGAAVHVTGGGGSDAQVYQRTKAFWARYFQEANGKIVRYSRVPLTFPAASI